MDNKDIEKKAAPHTPKIQKVAVPATLKRVGGFIIMSSAALENHVGNDIKFNANEQGFSAVIQKHGIGNSAILEDSEELLSLFANGDHDVTASIFQ